MGFASTWLEERALFPELINEAPDKQTGIIVVVPAYNEPGIVKITRFSFRMQKNRNVKLKL